MSSSQFLWSYCCILAIELVSDIIYKNPVFVQSENENAYQYSVYAELLNRLKLNNSTFSLLNIIYYAILIVITLTKKPAHVIKPMASVSKKVLIIGSGLGSSLLFTINHTWLSGRNFRKTPSGRRTLNQLKDGFTFDIGPSFFSKDYEFTELFKYCNIPNPLQMNELNPVYSVYFAGKKSHTLFIKNWINWPGICGYQLILKQKQKRLWECW